MPVWLSLMLMVCSFMVGSATATAFWRSHYHKRLDAIEARVDAVLYPLALVNKIAERNRAS